MRYRTAAERSSYARGRTKTGGLRRRKHEVSRTKDDPRYGRGTCGERAGPAVTKRCDDRHAVDAVSDCPAQTTAVYDSICHVSSCRWTSIRGRRRTLREAVALRRRPRRSLIGLLRAACFLRQLAICRSPRTRAENTPLGNGLVATLLWLPGLRIHRFCSARGTASAPGRAFLLFERSASSAVFNFPGGNTQT